MTDRVGQQFGNYRLTGLLGQGSFAEVYLGQHVRLSLQAAIKVLHTHLTGKEAEQFYQEAQTTASLVHPAIVRVFDFDVQEGVPFLVMDYAPGGSLRRRYPKDSVVPLAQILASVQQVAAALQYAHEHKVIHRDVKPENMLVGRHQQVLLSDFGLAALAHSTASEVAQGTVGTLAYMAPEQIEGHPRAASDQYALGVTVYEWLCGQRPFQGSLSQVMVQHLSLPPPALRERVPTISPKVEQLVLRALAKDPKQRFASVADFAQALEQAGREEASGQTLPLLASAYPAEAGHRVTSKPHLPAGTVTLLFTDIERSTQVLQQLGERYAHVLSECRHLLRAPFQQWHGYEVDTQGDAFFVVFAHATDAVSAAVAAQRALFAHVWPEGVTVRVRIGLHTGEPSVTSEGYVGLDVHRAARIMSAGHGGQVLLSQTTRDLVEQALPEGVSLVDVGAHRLKDLQQPSQLFQLVIAGCPADFPPLKTLDTQPNNLPVQPTPFIGRAQEVAAVAALLCREDVRLLTLTGPGGTGKTRLGLQVAAELSEVFPDGVFFVNLAPLSDPAFVLPAIAQVLDVKEMGGYALLDLLQVFLREKQLLLLLDNFEQVVRAALPLAELLAACPKLKIVVTSRMTLHVRAEHEFAVPPLALPDPTRLPDLVTLAQYEAVALFIQRAQAVKSAFQVSNATAPAVAAICVRLDGLPLAIELAAARIKLLPPHALLARLSQRLAVLTSGARDVPDRQQTLRKTIDWSYDLLEEAEKSLFRRLAVFVGGCTLEAAEAVCNANRDLEEDALDGVARLVDKSLLRQAAEIDGEPRLLLLETIREYGLERLAASGEAEAMRRQHATFFLQQALESFPKIDSAEQSTWYQRLEADHDNLRAALRWTLESQEVQMGLRLAGALGCGFWISCNHEREGRSWLAQMLAQPGAEARTLARARALRGLGLLLLAQGDFPEAQRLLEESVSIGRELGAAGTFDLAGALHILANVALLQGNLDDTRELAEESLRLFQELGVAWGAGLALHHLGRATLELGDPGAARPLLEESANQFRVAGDKQKLALSFNALGLVALQQGDDAGARTYLEEALSVAQEMGSKKFVADALAHLGTVALRRGEYHESLSFYQQSLALNLEHGYKYGLAEDLAGLAEVASLLGQPEHAARLLGAVEALREASKISLPPLRRAEYDRTVEGIRAHLDEATFAQAWAQGRAMPPEQFIVEVLKMGDEAGKQ